MAAWKRWSTLFELPKLYNSWRTLALAFRMKPCWLCGASAQPLGLCPACVTDLPRSQVAVRHRALPHIDRLYTPFRYAFPVNAMIQHAKFARDLAALHALAWSTYNEVSSYLPACDHVVPVPLSALRYIGRGFNQAVEIARPLMGLNVGCMSLNAIKRTRAGPPQSSLPANRRHANVHAAFELGIPTGAETVLIVDDVVTTGATLTAVARVLKQGGARRIHALAVADALV